MKFRRLTCGLTILGLGLGCLQAIDIDPSKKNVPDMPTNHNRFDIFAGDPARIQKANAINFADIQSSLDVAPVEVSLYSMKEEGLRPNLRVSFKVKDIGQKRTYTLSFPNAQRYDIIVRAPNNQIIYKWSADKLFVETVGTTMINPGDTLGYNELLPVADFYSPLSVGEYTVEATLANYPEITAKTILKVVPGQAAGTIDTTSPPPPAKPADASTSADSAKSPEVKPPDLTEPLPKT